MLFLLLKISEDGLIVMLDIGSVSSSLIVYGKNQQFSQRPSVGSSFCKDYLEKEIGYVDAQDTLFKSGLSVSTNQNNDSVASEGTVGIAEKTVYDSLLEDMRRSLRFYAKQTGQRFFLKYSIRRWCTPGLVDFVHQKLNIECAVFDPFENIEGKENLSISNSSQFTTALGLVLEEV